jgi:hypothetical protein
VSLFFLAGAGWVMLEAQGHGGEGPERHGRYVRGSRLTCGSYGGWAVFHLGAQVLLPDGSMKAAKDTGDAEGAVPLVDAISTAHPSWLTKDEIAGTRVPTQVIAPEHDMQLNPELKEFANKTIPALGLEYEYRYFPGVIHAFATKADEKVPGEMRAAERAKIAVVGWFLQILKT